MKTTIGGERLGSGNKMETNLKNYGRSTHNLSEDWISSAAAGVLYPFYVNVGLPGDTFTMNLEAACRTLPTQAPLFGSFKLQLDMFLCPMRLYQGILHNNPINIGMKMNQVKLPKINVPSGGFNNTGQWRIQMEEQINPSALLRYLGISGCGIINNGNPKPFKRKFNGVPVLAYYDIFKNYYANKQEANAYVIGEGETELEKQEIYNIEVSVPTSRKGLPDMWTDYNSLINTGGAPLYMGLTETDPATYSITMEDTNYNLNNLYIYFYPHYKYSTSNKWSLQELVKQDVISIINVDTITTGGGSGKKTDENAKVNDQAVKIIFQFRHWSKTKFYNKNHIGYASGNAFKIGFDYDPVLKNNTGISLISFPLENIDHAREMCLTANTLNNEVLIDDTDSEAVPYKINYLPYNTLTSWQAAYVEGEIDGIPYANNVRPMNGLCVKTYQSDLFNNWVQTEWITGENGINEITKIDVSNGLYMDALNLAQKVYDMLNRVAISGGTFYDYIEAVWTEKAQRIAETPMWIGGYSNEVVFEEVVQTTPTENSALGNLGGKGRLINNGHGGNIKIKITEPCIIMGIMSLTPRICYSQGNSWYMTELDTIDDLHKPALDGIGFQDLITEQMAWWDTHIHDNTGAKIRRSAGKVPAWINYMTSVNKAFGDFANTKNKGYMVLGRNYTPNTALNDDHIQDLTTYIDPSKFNYAFAYADLEAQNFWVQIRSKIIARRKMSAKIIPNL